MGMPQLTVSLIEDSLKLLDLKFDQCIMAELGNQHIRFSPYGSAKKYFSSLAVKHDSFDWNGKDGAHKLDLGKPLPATFRGKYNIVTNCGTSEHVHDQYWCFKNIDDLCTTGGIMIHTVPLKGNWIHHCSIYYNIEFFKKLAQLYEYEIIKLETDPSRGSNRHNVCCVYKKRQKMAKVSPQDFVLCSQELEK